MSKLTSPKDSPMMQIGPCLSAAVIQEKILSEDDHHVPSLKSVRFVGPSSLELHFVDKVFTLPIAKLEMPNDQIMWASAAASPTGEKITVNEANGEVIPIDSATLRYLLLSARPMTQAAVHKSAS